MAREGHASANDCCRAFPHLEPNQLLGWKENAAFMRRKMCSLRHHAAQGRVQHKVWLRCENPLWNTPMQAGLWRKGGAILKMHSPTPQKACLAQKVLSQNASMCTLPEDKVVWKMPQPWLWSVFQPRGFGAVQRKRLGPLRFRLCMSSLGTLKARPHHDILPTCC
jgi:hypothetical protein